MNTNIRVLTVVLGGILILGLIALALIPFSLARAQTVQTPRMPLCEFTRDLSMGSVGEDVHCLQRYLNFAGFTLASSGPGSAGNETRYFGPLTHNAVMRYQQAHRDQILTPLGLTAGTGYFGSMSFARYVQLVHMALGVR